MSSFLRRGRSFCSSKEKKKKLLCSCSRFRRDLTPAQPKPCSLLVSCTTRPKLHLTQNQTYKNRTVVFFAFSSTKVNTWPTETDKKKMLLFFRTATRRRFKSGPAKTPVFPPVPTAASGFQAPAPKPNLRFSVPGVCTRVNLRARSNHVPLSRSHAHSHVRRSTGHLQAVEHYISKAGRQTPTGATSLKTLDRTEVTVESR